MHSIINENNNFIKIFSKKPFFDDFDEIYFLPNMDITYYDNSHLNYIYVENRNDIDYTFHGFFKDNFFIIICDSCNKKLNTTLENKNVIIIKVKWIEKKYSEHKNIWIVDIPKFKDLKLECYVLAIRKKIFNNDCVSIEDYLRLYNFITLDTTIKYVPEKKKKRNILKFIISFLDL
jgi:hypothetical protein